MMIWHNQTGSTPKGFEEWPLRIGWIGPAGLKPFVRLKKIAKEVVEYATEAFQLI